MDFFGSMGMQQGGYAGQQEIDPLPKVVDDDQQELDMNRPFVLPTLQSVQEAQVRLREFGAVRTPLVKLNKDIVLMEEGQCPRSIEIYLKLETEQHCKTFKTRGAINYLTTTPAEKLQHGLVTPSVGSFGQALAYCANKMGVPHCTVFLPDLMDSHRAQLLKDGGALVHKLPFPEWWMSLEQRCIPPFSFDDNNPIHKAHFIHPATSECSAGDTTIALEILEDLPDVDTIVVPFCTGSFSSGMTHVLQQVKPTVNLYAAEVSTSTPLHSAMDAGAPTRCQHTPTFVDQIGGENVLPFMWQPIQNAGMNNSLVVTQQQIVEAISILKNSNGVDAEGAGATPLAAALAGKAGGGKVCVVVTGGNINPDFLTSAMRGLIPEPSFNWTA